MAANDFPVIDKIRLYVVDSEGNARSDLWIIHSTGDSVYLAPRNLGGALKLSLHPVGASRDGCDCQFGHPRPHAEKEMKAGFAPLPLTRWTRPATPDIGAVHVASVIFPTDFLPITKNPPKDGKVKFAVPLAPAGQVVEAALFFSREMPATLEDKFIGLGGTPLIYMDLPNGEFVSLVVRQTTQPDLMAQVDKMRSGQPRPLGGVPKPGGSLEGRGIIIGSKPDQGAAFILMEAGPFTISRAPEAVPSK